MEKGPLTIVARAQFFGAGGEDVAVAAALGVLGEGAHDELGARRKRMHEEDGPVPLLLGRQRLAAKRIDHLKGERQ